MSLFDYGAAAQTAISLINDFGQEAKLIKKASTTGPDYDPTAGTPTSIQIRLVDLSRMQMDRPSNETLEAVRSRTVYISTEVIDTEFVVERDDLIQIGGELASEIKEIQTLAPAGITVLWEVDLVR